MIDNLFNHVKQVTIIQGHKDKKRLQFAVKKLSEVLAALGFEVTYVKEEALKDYNGYRELPGEKIYIGCKEDAFTTWLTEKELLIYHSKIPEGEGFYLGTCPARLTVVSGGSDTGALYGTLELIERIEEEAMIPRELAFYDKPAFKLRGPSVGLQLTKIEPPRLTYEYPITPGRFPWFYDKAMWQEFLDMMLKERCNILYIWSGHPFSSLVKVSEYPEALEVTEEEYRLNHEVFAWLTEECDKRGIWVVLKFYNIHIPYPFAKHHNLELLQSKITPVVADYTAKSIIEFIKAFPNIGLMVCLGEALRGNQNKTEWFVDTIIPAVKEGIKQAGIKEEPPIILRGHDCDPVDAMNKAVKDYSNLYTMWKYNGESLTTYFPKGNWQKIHQSLSSLSPTHIINVHILADLEPFRFEAPLFIQKCVQASANRLGANGLHLYPLFYWDWPYSPDKTEPRLKQLDRDYIWFKAWFRYAWNPDRDERDEKRYWAEVFAEYYGTDLEGGRLLLEAMESAGECAPKILGRIGITEGNRQTSSLGMTMSQLTNVTRYRPNKELWYSVARTGEQPEDYIEKELKGEIHLGETPYDMISDVSYFAKRALDKCEEAKAHFSPDNQEFLRICKDVKAIYLMAESYNEKLKAAMKILKYKYTMDSKCMGDISLLQEALPFMENSLSLYRQLAELTEETYLYANSMQTPQRKIPFPNGETYGHWVQCLPEYEKELANYRSHLTDLENGILPGNKEEDTASITALTEAPFTLLSPTCETYSLEKKNSVFTDCDFKIQNLAPEITGLTGVRLGLGEAIEKGVTVRIELSEDSQILIGYMKAKGVEWLQVPDLETNTHADERGGLSAVYANALKAEGCPPIDIHAFQYEKGSHEIYLGTGAFVIAGVIPKAVKLVPRNAGLAGEGLDTLDWLYE